MSHSQDLFRTLADTAKDAIVIIDTHGLVKFWNIAAEKMFGYTASEVYRQNLHSLLAPDIYKEAYNTGFEHFKRTGKGNAIGKTLEFTALTKDKKEIIIELSVSSVEIDENWHAIGIIRDITERKIAEEKIRQYKDQLQIIYDGIVDGLAIADIETKQFLSVNSSMCKLFGYSEEEFLHKNILEIHPEKAIERVKAEFEKKVKGIIDRSIDMPCIKKDGTLFYADIVDSNITYNGKKCIVGFFRDTSERKKYEEEIKDKNRILADKSEKLEQLINVKNEFLGMVSHDLRNPLNSIFNISSSLLIAQTECFSEEQIDMLWHIKSCSKRLLLMVNDLLDLAAINAGKIHIIKQKIKVKEMLNLDTLPLSLTREDKIKLDFNIEEDLPEIEVDKFRFNQVLENLVVNAINYSEPNTAIKINACKLNDYLEISVVDQGPGIPEEEIKNIFKPFVFSKTSKERKTKSTGLGLAITKKIIELHDGQILVESKPGEGAKFSVLLPLKTTLN
jgi:PAS domain S-box-containing protein